MEKRTVCAFFSTKPPLFISDDETDPFDVPQVLGTIRVLIQHEMVSVLVDITPEQAMEALEQWESHLATLPAEQAPADVSKKTIRAIFLDEDADPDVYLDLAAAVLWLLIQKKNPGFTRDTVKKGGFLVEDHIVPEGTGSRHKFAITPHPV
jgi:hypothetical protein